MESSPSAPDIAQHPAPEDLAAFGQGFALLPAATERIERHLADCSACCQQVAAAPPDHLVKFIAGVGQARSRAAPATPLRAVAGYEILNELGRGGMGVVYRARQIGLNRLVALKRLRAGSLANADDLARFRREAEALGRLQYPNIVQVYDAGEQEGHPYLALEFVAGSSLRERLERSPLPAREAARMLAILAEAVDFAHRRGIIHRDLKPGNVLLAGPASAAAETGEFQSAPTQTAIPNAADDPAEMQTAIPKIADFGLAKLFGAESDQTRSGMLLGTPGYMAPEQSRGSPEGVGPAADIYALGAILYETLTGRPQFRAATPFETFELAHTCDPVPPRRLQPRVPRDLDTICLKCLRRDAGARYATAAALAEDLRRFLAGQPIAARPAGPVERLWKWTRRRPAWAALCAVGLLAAIGAAAGMVMHQRQLRQQTEHAERNYRDAWQSLQHVLLKIEDRRWGDIPQLDKLRREQLETAIPFFERILAQTSATNPETRSDRVQAHFELARLQSELGRHAEAERQANEAIHLLKELIAEPGARPKFLYLLGESYTLLAAQRLQTGDYQGELEYFQAALVEFQRADARVPNDKWVLARLADCYLGIGFAQNRLGRFDETEENYRRALEFRRRLWEADQQSTVPCVALAEAYFYVIEFARNRRPDAARAEVAELDPLLRPLAGRLVPDSEVAVRVAEAFLRWGKILATEDEPGALEKFAVGQRLLDESLSREPGARGARRDLSDLHGARARLAADHGRHADAVPDWDRAAALALAPAELRLFRVNRVISLAKGSFPDRALAEAAELASDGTLGPDDLVHLGRNLAFASSGVRDDAALPEEDRRETFNRYAEVTIRLLRKGAELGYFRDRSWRALLEEDPVFAALRERDDFRQFVAELSGLKSGAVQD